MGSYGSGDCDDLETLFGPLSEFIEHRGSKVRWKVEDRTGVEILI